MTGANAQELVNSLKPEEIRQRLDDLAAEEKALRVLLRAAVARQRKTKTAQSAQEASQ